MPHIKEDKAKGIEESFTPDFLEEIEEVRFEPVKVAGINDPQINQGIGIET